MVYIDWWGPCFLSKVALLLLREPVSDLLLLFDLSRSGGRA